MTSCDSSRVARCGLLATAIHGHQTKEKLRRIDSTRLSCPPPSRQSRFYSRRCYTPGVSTAYFPERIESMSSAAQLAANRANCRLSTGPVSEIGFVRETADSEGISAPNSSPSPAKPNSSARAITPLTHSFRSILGELAWNVQNAARPSSESASNVQNMQTASPPTPDLASNVQNDREARTTAGLP
jgi:hypothetical protein